VARPSIK